MKKSVAEIITEQIIERLEAGTIPWRKPWTPLAGPGAPRNLITGKPYRGINTFILACQSFSCPYWLTFKQAQDKGGNIRRGEKGTAVVFWRWVEVEDADTGEDKSIPFMRHYTVFNLEQTEGIEAPPSPITIEKPFNPIQTAEELVAAMPHRPEIRHSGNQAYYRPSHDFVNMPPQSTFHQEEGYYCTLFHELTHSSGHSSRLSRKGVTECTGFASHEYSKEELVAELGAAFLCAETGIEQTTIDNSAAYIQSWLKELKNDKTMVILAAGQAQKAADFIMNRNTANDLAMIV
jgi:antirestriction protein ArdC